MADNGGQTMTHSLLCTSPAIDKGFKFGLSTDQRGGSRPFDFADAVYPNAVGGDASDIGAYETQSAGGCVPTAIAPSPAPSTNEDTPVGITLTGTYSQNTNLSFSITQPPANGPKAMPMLDSIRQMAMTATDPFSAGRNFPSHFSYKQWNVVPVSSVIEIQYAMAPGTALVQKRFGGDGITIVVGGDAGTAEGDFTTCMVWSTRPGH